MAVSNVLGKAYIEVHADTSPFARELEKELAVVSESPAVTKASRKSGETISKRVTEGAAKQAEKDIPNFFKRFMQIFNKEDNRNKNFFLRAGRTIGSMLVQGISNEVSTLSSVGKGLASFFQDFSKGFSSSALPTLIAVGIPALIGLIIDIGAELGPLINGVALLPGLFGAVAASIGPVIVGFQGFGAAIQAIMSRDPTKIAAALKTLQPAARSVALEFQRMLPFLDQLKAVAQQSLFKGFTGDLTKLQKALGPTFLAGFKIVATDAGKLIGSLLSLFSQPIAQQFFKDLFKTADKIYTAFTPGLLKLVQGIIWLADASQPVIVDLFKGLGTTLGQFGDFLTMSVQNGDFQHFLDKFTNALDLLIQLGGSTWNLIGAIFGSDSDQQTAQDTFQAIINGIDSLTTFFKSDRGKQALKGMINLAGDLTIGLGAVGLGLLYILSVVGDIYDKLRWVVANTVGITEAHITKVPHKPTTNALGHHQDFAEGGIAMTPTYGWTGENGPEAVIPLNDPQRAQQIMNQAGLGQAGGGDVQFTVYIGDEQVMARVDKRVGSALKAFGRSTKYGPRLVGVGA